MRKFLRYSFIGLIIGVVFNLISFSSAHICQLIYGSTFIGRCRLFVYEFYYLAQLIGLSEQASYLLAMVIFALVFALIGLIIGLIFDRKK